MNHQVKRKLGLLIVLGLLFNEAVSQDNDQYKIVHYPSFELGISKGLNEFRNIAPKIDFHFNLDYVFTPVRQMKDLELGVQLGLIALDSRRDNVSGLEITSESAIVNFGLVTRWKPKVERKWNPYLDVYYGWSIFSATSQYELIDEATFWEEFLLDAEDEVYYEEAESFSDNTTIKGAGIGIEYNGWLSIRFRYHSGGNLKFVSKQDIEVVENEIQYNKRRAILQYYTIGLNFSLLKVIENWDPEAGFDDDNF